MVLWFEGVAATGLVQVGVRGAVEVLVVGWAMLLSGD